MNTNTLSRHYDTLKPRERLPLILAASARGDAVERERLTRTAPKECYRLMDYHGLADGLASLSLWHTARSLELAATYWHSSSYICKGDCFEPGAKGKTLRKRMTDLKRLMAYIFVVHTDAWKRLCEELKIDADVLLRLEPGYETIRLMDREARLTAFNIDEARAWVRKGPHVDGDVLTVETVLASLRAVLNDCVQRWA